MENSIIKKNIKDTYSKIAKDSECCCNTSSSNISKSIGYSDEEINSVSDANLGLGCGNPTSLSTIKEGDIVLDLGSGAGFDAFLAAKKVGKTGKVIGLDFSQDMINKAKINAIKYKYKNTEFLLGDIENMPLKDNSVDVIISNCVINLSINKDKVFSEAYRVLKENGRIFLSDIVLLKELSKEQRNDKDLIACCVGGALLKDDYLEKIKKAGFKFNILDEDKDISKRQYDGVALESLKIELYK